MHVEIFTDGSSLGNPGPGGFGAIIKWDDQKHIVKGGEALTTNNRMEMSAVIAALFWLHKNMPEVKTCTVYSDSSLVIQSLLQGWKRKKNLDLWEKMDSVIELFEKITWKWVKGHAGHKENTEADKVAVGEAKKWQRKINS
ncbi:ribonuclease HI [Candidatus Gracilibacteria bacterium]|nr:ribonuclease HI [Candidatus Gracilibacteria bacterium]